MNRLKHFCKHNLEVYPVARAIDFSIVSSNRAMRLIGSSKFGEIRPLKAPTWHPFSYGRQSYIQNFLITTGLYLKKDFFKLNKEYKKLSMIVRDKDWEKLSKTILKEKTIEPENLDSKTELDVLLDNIPEDFIDERPKWVKLVFCLLKLKVPIERIRKISMESDRYTESGFDSTIQSYCAEKCDYTLGTLRRWVKEETNLDTLKYFPPQADFSKDNDGVFQCYLDVWKILHKGKTYKNIDTMVDDVCYHLSQVLVYITAGEGCLIKIDNKDNRFSATKSSPGLDIVVSYMDKNVKGQDIEIQKKNSEIFSYYREKIPNYNQIVFKPMNHNVPKMPSILGLILKQKELMFLTRRR